MIVEAVELDKLFVIINMPHYIRCMFDSTSKDKLFVFIDYCLITSVDTQTWPLTFCVNDITIYGKESHHCRSLVDRFSALK